MIALSDAQLQTVMRTAHLLPVEKRDLYLQRIAAMLKLRRRLAILTLPRPCNWHHAILSTSLPRKFLAPEMLRAASLTAPILFRRG